jgi:UDP-N-acetylglucosamine enolpyruvyl transferase
MQTRELKRMGADISLDGSAAVINGVERISGAPVTASGLRASAALVLAVLPADGVTEVNCAVPYRPRLRIDRREAERDRRAYRACEGVA